MRSLRRENRLNSLLSLLKYVFYSFYVISLIPLNYFHGFFKQICLFWFLYVPSQQLWSGGTVSSPNYTFSWANLNKRLTSNSCTYEGWSKSSDRCLVALSKDIFERHTMHHSKDQVFSFIMMLIFSRCTFSFNDYSTLYMAHSIPLAFFSYYRIVIIFESDSFKPSIFKTAK